MASQISKKRKFVADGVFRAELGEFFTRELPEEVPAQPSSTIIIRATHTQEVLGEKGRRIRELTSLVQKRFKFPENSLELYAETVQNRGLPPVAQACYGVLRFVMQSAAKSYEVVVSGKLRAARAKSMKFMDVFMILSGQTAKDYVDYVVRRVLLRQGVLGLKVKMYGWDPEGRIGPRNPLPDTVTIFDPPVNKRISEPVSEQRGPTNVDAVAAPMAAEEEHAAPEDYQLLVLQPHSIPMGQKLLHDPTTWKACKSPR
ncbi:40S ribosomal protein S3 [Tulasnella sp. 331]|nr:40S ribosomal protein S3 [Tulasnella sp. 331]